MAFNLKGRSLLKLDDFTPQEIHYLLDLAKELKELKKAGVQQHLLKGKNIALIFEKPSTRTRCAFTVACVDEGAHPEYLNKNDVQFGKKESVADTAKVLGRMFDGIEFRGFKHEVVEELALYAGVPVWNGLTDLYHPTQVLADLLTLQEQRGRLRGLKLAYVGDGRNNMANSLMMGAAKMGMDFRIASPRELSPDPKLVAAAQEVAAETLGSVQIMLDPVEAVRGVDAIYTDVWVSMGEEHLFAERIALLRDYQVNMNLIRQSGNPEVLFMHCLPAFHDLGTELGREIYEKYGLTEMEVTDEVFQSRHSIVFDQAENRVHTIKAVMVATL
jgi:ornithine carbamoyltransferase